MLQVIVSSILDLLLVVLLFLLFGMTVLSARWHNLREFRHLNERWAKETIGYTL